MTSQQDVAAWDAEAEHFDAAADHGLSDPAVRDAWRRLLLSALPRTPANVADLGCGTGTLSVLLTDEGYTVDGVDFSPRMIELAEAKADGRPGLRFLCADAYEPPLEENAYEAVLCRHVLWAMPDPDVALARWVGLLRDGGVLILIEGSWSTGVGLSADATVALVEATGRPAVLTRLPESVYWGREIEDERYLVTSPSPSG